MYRSFFCLYLVYLHLLVSGNNLKVNYSPYLIDIVLFGAVDSLKHKATVKDGILSITLVKKEPSLWNQLEVELDKDAFQLTKAEALKSHYQLEEQLATKQKDRKIEEERHAVRQQMALDTAERERMEAIQAEEKAAAEKDVYETLARLQQGEIKKQTKHVSFTSSPGSADIAKPSYESDVLERAVEFDKKIYEIDDVEGFDEEDIDDENLSSSPRQIQQNDRREERRSIEEEVDEDVKYIPPPRQVFQSSDEDQQVLNPKVTINFTPRLFPTPMRESKAAEEEDWIAKNRRHLKHHGVLGKGLKKGKFNVDLVQTSESCIFSGGQDVSEEDPVWLKAKGDDFFRSGDIRSAINAYSAAIDADDSFIQCYSNRAVCYLQIQLFSQCKLDCDKAILLIQEKLPPNLDKVNTSSADKMTEKDVESFRLMATLVKLLLRRGNALCSVGLFQESYTDYSQALVKYQQLPANIIGSSLTNITIQSIQSDIDRLKLLCSIEAMKKEADTLIGDKQLHAALEKYDKVLEILPIHVSALSNRAGCKIALGDIEGAIVDCTTAIDLLKMNEEQRFARSDGMKNMLSAILPSPSSDKRKQWLLKTTLRKAVALVQLERLTEAIEVYNEAMKIDPSNDQIKLDHDKLVAHVNQQ